MNFPLAETEKIAPVISDEALQKSVLTNQAAARFLSEAEGESITGATAPSNSVADTAQTRVQTPESKNRGILHPAVEIDYIRGALNEFYPEGSLPVPLNAVIENTYFLNLELLVSDQLENTNPQKVVFLRAFLELNETLGLTVNKEGSNFPDSELYRQLRDGAPKSDFYSLLARPANIYHRTYIFWYIYRFVGRAPAFKFVKDCANLMAENDFSAKGQEKTAETRGGEPVEKGSVEDWIKSGMLAERHLHSIAFVRDMRIQMLDSILFPQSGEGGVRVSDDYKTTELEKLAKFAEKHAFNATQGKSNFASSEYWQKLQAEMAALHPPLVWEEKNTSILSELAIPKNEFERSAVLLLTYRMVGATQATELLHTIGLTVDTYLKRPEISVELTKKLGDSAEIQELYRLMRVSFSLHLYSLEDKGSGIFENLNYYFTFPSEPYEKGVKDTIDKHTVRAINKILVNSGAWSSDAREIMYAITHHKDTFDISIINSEIQAKYKISHSTTLGELLRILHGAIMDRQKK